MSTIPTPFIGGTGGPPPDRRREEKIAPPFYTEPQGPPPQERQEPAPEELVDLVLTEQPAAEEPAGVEESLEAALLEEAAEPLSEGEELVDLVFSEPLAEEPEPQTPEQTPPTAAAPTAVAEPEPARPEPVTPAETDEDLTPDFLMGPDAIGPDEPMGERAEGSTVLPTYDELDGKARELLAGPLAERISALMSDLGPGADQTAISRAFAAGYLAASAQEES